MATFSLCSYHHRSLSPNLISSKTFSPSHGNPRLSFLSPKHDYSPSRLLRSSPPTNSSDSLPSNDNYSRLISFLFLSYSERLLLVVFSQQSFD
jgi:hypothetical protein